MKRFFQLLTLGLVFVSVLLVQGCLGGTGGEEKVITDPAIEISTLRVNQYTEFGRNRADGQYVVLKILLHNSSNNKVTIAPAELVLQNITSDPSEQYEQEVEKRMSGAFSKVFGKEVRGRIIENQSIEINPKLTIERYMVFMLNNDINLGGYQLLYKAENSTFPIVTPHTEVFDYRSNYGG